MENKNDLIEKVRRGFETVDLDEKYKKEALSNLEIWIGGEEEFLPYQPQIKFWIENEKWDLIIDSFFQIIPFGTGGRRGLVGIGTNRINPWTIKNSAQGHSQYLLKKHGEEAREKGVVISYGVRVFLDDSDYDSSLPNPVMNLSAKELAASAAQVYAANGIKVHLYKDYGTTPELSFSIRYLGAIAGAMIDASHNPPTDCGKKVFDLHGGQLIPPFDQELTDEVTKNVSKVMELDFDEAKNSGLIVDVSESVREAYYETVAKLSLSEERDLRIAYTPLHGPGLFSVKPILEKAGFKVEVDPLTSNISARFENVKFNIPNPEVIQSFENSLKFAEEQEADLILSTDPDADRIGIMVWYNKKWRYINGNEIGIILTNFAIGKSKTKNGVVIKTDVTTGLISKIAKTEGKEVIDDLLVGFKYIAEEMNKLEKGNRMNDFIFGAEESHGFIAGDYARDKDAAIAALWLCDLAAELKKQNKTLVEYLDEIYSKFGYFKNYLTEIRMLGAEGLDNISKMQTNFRENEPKEFGQWKVREMKDWLKGKPFVSRTDEKSRNVITFYMEPKDNKDVRVTVRPSGTEPKIKFYIEVGCQPCGLEELEAVKMNADEVRKDIEKSLLGYCYKVVGVDFPERGYLLFWQLPLKIKMQYFAIEENIVKLKENQDVDERKKELEELLKFLGSDPIEKVDDAFKAKYKKGIREYLEI